MPDRESFLPVRRGTLLWSNLRNFIGSILARQATSGPDRESFLPVRLGTLLWSNLRNFISFILVALQVWPPPVLPKHHRVRTEASLQCAGQARVRVRVWWLQERLRIPIVSAKVPVLQHPVGWLDQVRPMGQGQQVCRRHPLTTAAPYGASGPPLVDLVV